MTRRIIFTKYMGQAGARFGIALIKRYTPIEFFFHILATFFIPISKKIGNLSS